jgi:hypothetical protein
MGRLGGPQSQSGRHGREEILHPKGAPVPAVRNNKVIQNSGGEYR